MVYYTTSSLQDASNNRHHHAIKRSSSRLLIRKGWTSRAVAAAHEPADHIIEKTSLSPLPFNILHNGDDGRMDDPAIAGGGGGGHAPDIIDDGRTRPDTTSISSHMLSVYKNPLWSEQRLGVPQGKKINNSTAEPLEEDEDRNADRSRRQAIEYAVHGLTTNTTTEQEGDDDAAVNYCNNEMRHLPFLSSPRLDNNNITESMSTSGTSSITSACEFDLVQKLDELQCSPGAGCRSFQDHHVISPRRLISRKPKNYQRSYHMPQTSSDQQHLDSETLCREQNGEYHHAGDNKSQQMKLTSGLLDHELEGHCCSNEIDHIRAWLPNQQFREIPAPNGENATKCNDVDTQWYIDHEDYKGKIGTLSSQEVDFLFQHSDVLAEFEREEFCNLEKTVETCGIKTHGRDFLDHSSTLHSNSALASLNIPSRMHKFKDEEEKKCPQETKEQYICFDDTSSWSTSNSEAMASNHFSEASNTTTSLVELDGVSDALRKHPHHDHAAATATTKELLYQLPKEATNPPPPPPRAQSSEISPEDASQKCDDSKVEDWQHETDIGRKNEKEFAGDQLVLRNDVEALQRELLDLKRQNRSLERSLKENEQIVENFAKEKVLWEQKKLSDISMFNRFKEEETRRLRRERSRLEKQAKLLSHLPSKKERNEMEELRSKIASISEDHFKKDSLQRLTINRLRRTIGDLTEQIHALQEEVKRYEGFLQAEWDTVSLKGEVYSTRKYLNQGT